MADFMLYNNKKDRKIGEDRDVLHHDLVSSVCECNDYDMIAIIYMIYKWGYTDFFLSSSCPLLILEMFWDPLPI